MYDALTHFGAADQWYRKSLAIRERLRDQPGLAKSYHELGTIALMLLDLDAAKDWYRKALTINERLRNQHGAAMTYHQLGSVAQMKQQYDDAEAWFRKHTRFSSDSMTTSALQDRTRSSAG